MQPIGQQIPVMLGTAVEFRPHPFHGAAAVGGQAPQQQNKTGVAVTGHHIAAAQRAAEHVFQHPHDRGGAKLLRLRPGGIG